MKRIKFILLSLLLVGSLIAQDLSKLNPQQIEAYKKYKSANSSATSNPGNNNENTTTEQDRTVNPEDTQKPEVPENKTTTTTTTRSVQNIKSDKTFDNGLDSDDKKTITTTTTTVQNGIQTKKDIFGSKLFSKQNITFEPKLNIATPVNYIIGTYDEIIIDISGLYEVNYKLKVSPEGTIRIPNVGPIKVSGITIEDATRIIRNKVSRIYSGVSTGQTRVNISLGNIRSIRVSVVGEAVRPGSYTLPSLATAFNALYACGGPDSVGSMRDIKVVRANKVIANLDVYRFLLDGVLINNVSLQDGDLLKIEPYKIRATINGAVKHGGIFEAIPGETLQNLIRFAGGYADDAYKATITTIRFNENGKTVVDVAEKEIASFQLQSGDSCEVSSMGRKFDNRVDIVGSVYRPGAYALDSSLTITKLIAKADGVKEDAYLNMAYITRRKSNHVPEIVGFNLGKVLQGIAPDILLEKDDSVNIVSLYDYREEQFVSISGAVQSPGKYPLLKNISLRGLILKAKGFLEIASTDSIVLIRVIKDQEILRNTTNKTIVMKFSLDKDLNFTNGSGDVLLENGDQVIVRSISGFEGILMVRVEGEVRQPGNYNISNKAERISNIIQRSGGFTNYAYPLGAFLIRTEKTSGVEQKLQRIVAENSKKQIQKKGDNTMDLSLIKATGAPNMQQAYSEMDSLQNKKSGTKVVNEIFKSEGVVGINLKKIMERPGSKYDLNLEEGDILFIPRKLETVRVIGEVLFPTYVRYDESMNFKDYVSNAGGFSDRAMRSSAFVLYANGTAKSTTSFLGFKFYPKIQPGARIIIPEKPTELRSKLTPMETVSILTSIMTVATLVYSVTK